MNLAAQIFFIVLSRCRIDFWSLGIALASWSTLLPKDFASLKLALIMARLENFNYLQTHVSVYHSHLFLVIVRFKRPIEEVATVTRLKPTNGGTVSAQQGVNMVKATRKILATNISIDWLYDENAVSVLSYHVYSTIEAQGLGIEPVFLKLSVFKSYLKVPSTNLGVQLVHTVKLCIKSSVFLLKWLVTSQVLIEFTT